MNAQSVDLVTKGDLKDVKEKLTAKIEANAMKIEANAVKIETNRMLIEKNRALIEANAVKIEANAAKIEANGKGISSNNAALARISGQVVENRDLIRRMITREEFKAYFDEIISAIDGLAAKFTRLDEERVVTNARFSRLEADVEKNKGEIAKIKSKLAMP